MERYLGNATGDEISELRGIDRLSLLFSEHMRTDDLPWLVFEDNLFVESDLAVIKHRSSFYLLALNKQYKLDKSYFLIKVYHGLCESPFGLALFPVYSVITLKTPS